MSSLLEIPAPDGTLSVRSIEIGRLSFHLAATRGYCYGVERALRLIDETIESFPDRRILLTSEIIHNPSVNEALRGSGVEFLDERPDLWETLGPNDIVVVPAFGVAPSVRRRVDGTGALVVDTTCGSVVFVWKNVDRFRREGRALLYHGRRGHEEALATLGRLDSTAAAAVPAGPTGRPHPHVIVENLEEAEVLARWLESSAPEAALREALPGALSRGLRPATDLSRLGFANQTTMLASESLAIARRVGEAHRRRYGESSDPVEPGFRLQDTICRATDERQEALGRLLDTRPHVLVVVGGFNSSNTSHLAEIARERGVPAFHIEGPQNIRVDGSIRHRDPSTHCVVESSQWLPAGTVRVGISSGASTPEASVREVVSRIADLS